ncbi:MFS transporter [Actinomadura sp. 6N118]|uniref:MFS transporter n=1 Tax=Actinomadura sp. 6N118 TaxID=3375151 RepID=UPI00379885B6
MAGKGRTGLLISAFMGTFIALLDLTIVNVALPEIQADLHTDVTGLQWVADGFTVPLAALMLSGGALGDRFGRKRLFLSGIGLFVAGSVVCAAASSLGVLVAGRVVQGVAAAIVIPGALSLILQELRGYSAMETGVLLLPMTLAIMPAAVVAGRLTAAFGARRPMVLGYTLTGVALAGMGMFDAGTPYLAISVLFVVAGAGQGLAITPAAAAVLEIVPRERTGIASATVNTARQAGTALGIAVLGTVAAGSGGLEAGLRTSLVAAGAVVLAAAALLILMPGRGSHPRSTSGSPRADAGIRPPGHPAGT